MVKHNVVHSAQSVEGSAQNCSRESSARFDLGRWILRETPGFIWEKFIAGLNPQCSEHDIMHEYLSGEETARCRLCFHLVKNTVAIAPHHKKSSN